MYKVYAVIKYKSGDKTTPYLLSSGATREQAVQSAKKEIRTWNQYGRKTGKKAEIHSVISSKVRRKTNSPFGIKLRF